MRVSDKGVAEIAAHEGIVPMPYRDSVGVWTFGVGHTASAGPPNPATMPKGVEQPMSEVIKVFRSDLTRFEIRVNAAVKVPLQQHEFDALVSFDFNTGGINRAQLTNHLNAGNRVAAADAFMGWSKPPEIIPRRQAEQRLFRTGQYGSGMATVYPADAQGRVQWSKGRRVNVLELMGSSQPTPAPGLTYTVRSGDTLGKIAFEHGTTVMAIVTLNGIADPNRISVGQVLRLPQKPQDAPEPPPAVSPAPEPPRAPAPPAEPPRHDPALIALVAAVAAAVGALAAHFGLD